MSEQGAVPMIVMTRSQDHVEAINSSLRKAGHPVHCTWLPDASDLGDALTQLNPEMLIAFMDELSVDLVSIMKIKQQSAPGMPVVIVREKVDEAAIAEAMRLGCQDLVSLANRERLQAVVSRELRAHRLERALSSTLSSAREYREQLQNFLEGSADAITHVQEGGFYGWPYFYMGGHEDPDPKLKGKHPELKDKVLTPDVLLQPHFASLEVLFYEGSQFPAEYKGDAFAAEHGSWNKHKRAGYEVIRVPMKDGKATGEYEDFLTGFVTADGQVWGRPVGVAVAKDGSLFVSDDGTHSIWHVTYTGK